VIAFVADVPPLGYRTYELRPAGKPSDSEADSSLQVEPARLENRFYVVELDERHGGITRILDKGLGLEVLAASGVSGNELWSPREPRISSVDSDAELSVLADGPLQATVEVRSSIGRFPYKARITVHRDLKRIDVELSVDYGGGRAFGPRWTNGAGLFVRFPLAFDGRLHVNQPFGVYEAEASPQIALDFADVSSERGGLAVIHENLPNLYRDGRVLSFTLASGYPNIAGKRIYRYSLYSHEGDVHQGGVARVAQSANTGFVVSVLDGGAGSRADAARSFFECDSDNIVLSGLFRENGRVYARFYETAGRSTQARIELRLPGLSEARRVELDNRVIGNVPVDDGAMTLGFGAWELITVRLE
jgi:alpha-mannosidase